MPKLPEQVFNYLTAVDLDALIMSDECSHEFIQTNLHIKDDLVYDAIKNSVNSGWLLKLDVFRQFTGEFQARILHSFEAFPRLTRIYFKNQLDASQDESLLQSYHQFLPVSLQANDPQLFNPMSMLGNGGIREDDLRILKGELTLRKLLLDRIQKFLKSSDRTLVDFSFSLFMPEMLTPKFFHDLTEAEQIVLLTNLDKYFEFLVKFGRTGGRMARQMRSINPPQVLIKHILSGELPYTNRVKMLAWRGFVKEVDRLNKGAGYDMNTAILKLLDEEQTKKIAAEITQKKMDESGHTSEEIIKWAKDAEGVFESFELDCTIHNINAVDMIWMLMSIKPFWPMVDQLVQFQDDDTRNRIFKDISSVMKNWR